VWCCPSEIVTGQIYRLATSFIDLQLFGIFVVWLWLSLVNWLPSVVFW
jgi:TRAP-type mannitol/chloroaromatic compound transport system permease large subunit